MLGRTTRDGGEGESLREDRRWQLSEKLPGLGNQQTYFLYLLLATRENRLLFLGFG